jgi:drug/metabolite transporter (DMT)-like permease
MNKKLINWGIFILLAVIWGSSFLLMKIGMQAGSIQLSPYQVASLRMVFAGIVLVPFAFQALKNIPKNKIGLVILSGIIGNFIPAYLFCIAETKIDSALAGILNSLTPLFTILVGMAIFKVNMDLKKIGGVLLGLVGLCVSVVAGKTLHFENFSFSFFIMIATICYGINVNMVGKHMQNISAIHIASVAFSFSVIPGVIILYMTGYFNYDFKDAALLHATLAGGTLGVINTSIASILFYILVKRAGILFASTVTYAIPFVSLAMGLIYNEPIHPLRLVGLAIILIGVYLVNKRSTAKES